MASVLENASGSTGFGVQAAPESLGLKLPQMLRLVYDLFRLWNDNDHREADGLLRS
jgi:hypothetical protein